MNGIGESIHHHLVDYRILTVLLYLETDNASFVREIPSIIRITGFKTAPVIFASKSDDADGATTRTNKSSRAECFEALLAGLLRTVIRSP